MAPQFALVGRPNVGKSTLFNRLTGTRDAIVADVPGLTRDRRYGRAVIEGRLCMLVDTGGLLGEDDLADLTGRQAGVAVAEADTVVFMVDARDGLTVGDEEIAGRLRKSGCDVVVVVNKIDGQNPHTAESEFAGLGFEEVCPISAAHGRGVGALRDRLAARLPESAESEEAGSGTIRTAVIGRPNVGKSTLINRLLGEERQVVFDRPGTTRDAIEVPFERGGDRYLLIDTAGVRRRGRVDAAVEKFSVIKALQAMERAHVVIVMVDGLEGLVDQDLHVLQHGANAGAGLVIAVNKWDGIDAEQRRARMRTLQRRLEFVPWAPVHTISALRGSGVGRLLNDVKAVYRAGAFEVGTTRLNRILQDLVQRHPPPTVRGRQIKLRYVHKAGDHPPRIIVHGNQTGALPASYVRYLENGFREVLNLVGNPMKVEVRTSANPYAGKRNQLTRRQRLRRKRVMRHGRGR
ncbi:MAG: ribosome biogenesis GTPase Der [Gammaproteobacteria bacterium]|nr:ribosome biogenesis GTPase Der [Gammaproteobacteria bacterium]